MQFNINLFITPLIAISLVLWGYCSFKKRINDNGIYHRYLVVIGLLSFFLNWIWELAQGPLYDGFEYDFEHISFCGLASIADMLMVYVLLFGFALIYKNIFWIRELNSWRILWLMLAGSVGAILAEVRHLAAGNWSYAETMPLMPWVEAGLLPVLQFTLLPVFIFLLTNKLLKKQINA